MAVVLAASVYPIYMGVKVVSAVVRDGHVHVGDYPKYVIPYAPICVAVILATALVPVAVRYLKGAALPVLSVSGVSVFLVAETQMEAVTVFSEKTIAGDIGTWQAWMCMTTPEVMQTVAYQTTIGQELVTRYSPVFKVHFYLIAVLMVLAVIYLAHGFYSMSKTGNFSKRRPLIIQSGATGAYAGLCVFAVFTAFFRTGDIRLSLVSSGLMIAFFTVFGVTAGFYVGGLLYGRTKLLSYVVPATVAALTTTAMYAGELVMMGGVVFKYGDGAFFEPLGVVPLAAVDMTVIVGAAGITYLLLWLIRDRTAAVDLTEPLTVEILP